MPIDILEPGNLYLLLRTGAVVLLWTRWFQIGRLLALVTALIGIFVATVPAGRVFIANLENRFEPPRPMPERIDGIIYLSDNLKELFVKARKSMATNAGQPRIIELELLAKNYPDAQVVISQPEPFQGKADATHLFAEFLELHGFDPKRGTLESGSGNTYEQASSIRRLKNPHSQETWLLVTTASAMPRAIGGFRKAGWNVLAYPIDFVTTGEETLAPTLDMLSGWGLLRRASIEGVALVADRLMGRTDALVPSAHK